MVRLVFRPYTQLRRSICTSESLRTSTRVSSGFILARHSSPSFGSQHVCSWYLPTARALGRAGQSRIGRRDRAGRTPERARPKTRGPPAESPSRADATNNRFATRRLVASPGPAPPCVQASRSSDHRAHRSTRRAGGLRGKGSHPAHPLSPSLASELTPAASAGRGSAPEGAEAPSFHFHCAFGFSEPSDSHTC